MKYTFALLVATSAAAFAAPPIVVAPDPRPAKLAIEEDKRPAPAEQWTEFRARPGQLLRLALGDGAAGAKWTLVDTLGADIEPCAEGKRCTFAAEAEGRFRLIVTVGETIHRVAVVVARPKPPEPPKPKDELVGKFQAAADKDTRDAAKKKGDLLDLVELYKQAQRMVVSSEITTTAKLVEGLRESTRRLQIDGLTDLRRAIAVELAAAFPTDEQLTDTSRAKAASLFKRIQAALQEVGI
jgi:hypothetical protein